jgi:ribosomal protein S18 acetylase RimI-like enzyme
MTTKPSAATTSVEHLTRLSRRDLNDLCDATEAAIVDGSGFGWLKPPQRRVLEGFWRGALLVPGRDLLVGRLDGTIAASAQFIRPTANQEARAFAATLSTHFVAPWARGHGLARALVDAVEAAARAEGFDVLNLDVRETQAAAMKLYEACGFECWGVSPYYARVDGRMIAGHYYVKHLT